MIVHEVLKKVKYYRVGKVLGENKRLVKNLVVSDSQSFDSEV